MSFVKKSLKTKGFTLIEMLIVVTIIGIIGLAAVVTISESRARGRDARRVSEAKALHQALAMYINKYNFYPVQTAEIAVNGSDALSNALRAESILIGPLADPNTGQMINGEFFDYYYITDAQGRSYTLRYCLETSSITGGAAGCGNTVTQ